MCFLQMWVTLYCKKLNIVYTIILLYMTIGKPTQCRFFCTQWNISKSISQYHYTKNTPLPFRPHTIFVSSLLNNSETLVTPQRFSQVDINSSTNTLDFNHCTINLHLEHSKVLIHEDRDYHVLTYTNYVIHKGFAFSINEYQLVHFYVNVTSYQIMVLILVNC